MKKALFIAEKDSVKEAVKDVYMRNRDQFDEEITFVAQSGHLVQLLSPSEIDKAYEKWDVDLLPINPVAEGGWRYKVAPEKRLKEKYNIIATELSSGKYDYVYHAGDPDAEGELLVNLVLWKANNTLPVKRFWNNAKDDASIINALKNAPSDSDPMYVNLCNSALVRQHADWLFGMNGSRAIADKVKGQGIKIAVGRVMTWIQTQIVLREDEINNFVPVTTYGVDDIVKAGNSEFVTHMIENKAEVFYPTKEEAEEIIKKLSNTATVKSYDKKRRNVKAPKLYKLSTLQQDGSKLGYTASQTLAIVQSLYEKKYLTYPRTDCEYLGSGDPLTQMVQSASCVTECVPFIATANANINNYLSDSQYINDKETAKHGHTAIVPTVIKPNFASLSGPEQKIYRLVAMRFIASLMDPMVEDVVDVILDDNGVEFRAKGKTVISLGFNELLKNSSKDIELPTLAVGDVLTVKAHEVREKTSKCPSRFTDASLIAFMDNPAKSMTDEALKKKCAKMVIGTSATRSGIIDKLVENGYISRNKKEYAPTEFGSAMIHHIIDMPFCKTEMTGSWDLALQGIREGEKTKDEVEAIMLDSVLELIQSSKELEVMSRFGGVGYEKVQFESVGTCVCGNELLASEKSYKCPKCKKAMPKSYMGASFSIEDVATLFNGGSVNKHLQSKDGKEYDWELKLNSDPKSKFPFERVVGDLEGEKTDYKCPLCKKALVLNEELLRCECGFKMKTKICDKVLDESVINELLTNKKTAKPVDGFISSKGTEFSAKLQLKKDKTYGWGAAFIFDKRGGK